MKRMKYDTIKEEEGEMSQDDPIYKEEDIKNILHDLFQHSELSKEELKRLFEYIADKYI